MAFIGIQAHFGQRADWQQAQKALQNAKQLFPGEQISRDPETHQPLVFYRRPWNPFDESGNQTEIQKIANATGQPVQALEIVPFIPGVTGVSRTLFALDAEMVNPLMKDKLYAKPMLERWAVLELHKIYPNGAGLFNLDALKTTVNKVKAVASPRNHPSLYLNPHQNNGSLPTTFHATA